VNQQERIAQLLTIRTLINGLLKAEAGAEVAPCCSMPQPKNFGTFAGEDWRCASCGTPVVNEDEKRDAPAA